MSPALPKGVPSALNFPYGLSDHPVSPDPSPARLNAADTLAQGTGTVESMALVCKGSRGLWTEPRISGSGHRGSPFGPAIQAGARPGGPMAVGAQEILLANRNGERASALARELAVNAKDPAIRGAHSGQTDCLRTGASWKVRGSRGRI